MQELFNMEESLDHEDLQEYMQQAYEAFEEGVLSLVLKKISDSQYMVLFEMDRYLVSQLCTFRDNASHIVELKNNGMNSLNDNFRYRKVVSTKNNTTLLVYYKEPVFSQKIALNIVKTASVEINTIIPTLIRHNDNGELDESTIQKTSMGYAGLATKLDIMLSVASCKGVPRVFKMENLHNSVKRVLEKCFTKQNATLKLSLDDNFIGNKWTQFVMIPESLLLNMICYQCHLAMCAFSPLSDQDALCLQFTTNPDRTAVKCYVGVKAKNASRRKPSDTAQIFLQNNLDMMRVAESLFDMKFCVQNDKTGPLWTCLTIPIYYSHIGCDESIFQFRSNKDEIVQNADDSLYFNHPEFEAFVDGISQIIFAV